MPGFEVEIAPPQNWQDFERLTLDYARRAWKDNYAQRNGRQGQTQAGVDIFGHNQSANEFTGIQCKKKQNYAPSSKRLTASEIDHEVSIAMGFEPKLDRFVIATTGQRDAKLQAYVNTLNNSQQSLLVSLMFWEDYQDFLNDNIDLMCRYYKDVLEYRNRFDEVEQYLHLIRIAFDRPAIKTPFHLENRATDFIKAISDTQSALATGRLEDREFRIIDECKVPTTKIAGLDQAADLLQQVREIATRALLEGEILEHESVIEIRSKEVVQELNSLRERAVFLLNEELIKHNLNPVLFRDN